MCHGIAQKAKRDAENNMLTHAFPLTVIARSDSDVAISKEYPPRLPQRSALRNDSGGGERLRINDTHLTKASPNGQCHELRENPPPFIVKFAKQTWSERSEHSLRGAIATWQSPLCQRRNESHSTEGSTRGGAGIGEVITSL